MLRGRKVVTSINITKENYDYIRKEADKENRSLSSYLDMLISGIRQQK